MGYDARDLLFDSLKEFMKQGMQGDIRRHYAQMRGRVAQLPEETREQALEAIDELEQKNLLRIESEAQQAGAMKEMIKLIEGASRKC